MALSLRKGADCMPEKRAEKLIERHGAPRVSFKKGKSLSLVFIFLLFTLFFSALVGPSCTQKLERADLVIVNARIYTVNPAQPWAEAVAIKGEKIIYVGSSKVARRYLGRATQIIEAQGRLLLPRLSG
jgi:hypothetical protein